MKKLTYISVIIAFTSFFLTDCGNRAKTQSDHVAEEGAIEEDIDSDEDTEGLWIDTVMFAKGHAFGYSGDITMWGGWYFDTVFVGDERMLTYDSVGPATLKLSLVTREMLVDFGDPYAPEKIKDFLKPMAGFSRFQKSYEECLDSVVDEEYGTRKYMGEFSFTADYADSSNVNADKINRFMCQLTNVSETERAQVPALSATYAGYNTAKLYRPVYSGSVYDMTALSDFVAHKTFENWKRGGNYGIGSTDAQISIKPHIANDNFVTFGKYEYEREGIGHGMYTETFHTFDLKTGKKLTNSDIFKGQSIGKVKMMLFEVMAEDPHYLQWHGDSVSSSEIETMIGAWQSPSDILDGTEWEEPEREVDFKLPDGALTNTGVVFSFQPYEIDCWAAGTYHFIVPYTKLEPYLTPKAKALRPAAALQK